MNMNQFNGLPGKKIEGGLINDTERLLFGLKLRVARKKLEEEKVKTFDDIAREIGVDKSSCNAWEKGMSLPEQTRLGRIAVAYKIEGDDYNNFMQAFDVSTEAREVVKSARKQKSGQSISPLDPNMRARNGSKGHFPAADNGNF